jgi:thymidine phosphorylase
LIKVKFEPADKNDESEGHKLFKKEIEMFVRKIKKEHKSEEDMASRINSCSND